MFYETNKETELYKICIFQNIQKIKYNQYYYQYSKRLIIKIAVKIILLHFYIKYLKWMKFFNQIKNEY